MAIRSAAGFSWDAGNLAKCQKHGLAIAEVEAVFHHRPMIAPDQAQLQDEQRFIAIGSGSGSRSIFVVFTLRELDEEALIRPISARFMHEKEIASHEEDTAKSAN